MILLNFKKKFLGWLRFVITNVIGIEKFFTHVYADLYSLTINKKLVIAIGLVSAIALSITAISTFSIVIFTIEERTKDQLVTESIVRGETIQTFFDLKTQQIQNLAKNLLLQKTINDINRLEDQSNFEITLEEKRLVFLDEINNFQSSLDNQIELDNLYILGQDDRIYFSLDKESNENLSSYVSDSFTTVKTSLIEFTPLTVFEDGNAIISVPVYVSEENTNSEPMGTIIAILNIQEINQILHKSFASAGSDTSFLVKNENLIILKSRSENDDSSILTLNTVPIKACFDEGRNYYGKYLNSDNEQVYGFSYCATDLNLSLLTEINESDVLKPIANLQQSFLLIGITILAGVGFVSFFLSRSISQPILKLKDATDEISNGNFNVRSKIKSGDEIEQLSTSFDLMAKTIQDSLEKIKQKDIVIKEQHELLLEFSENKQKCCVGVIDIVSSTKITANLTDAQTRNFYGIFINFMASIVDDFGGIVVKNIGDALLFYFPETNRNRKQYFENVINCCMMMINSHSEVNDKMDDKGLSSLSYRISAHYGPIMIAQMSTSSVADIFGSTVNVCTKINSMANPNELVIGEELYDILKSNNHFSFKQKSDYFLNDEIQFKVYSVENNFPSEKKPLSYLHA